MSNSPDSSGPPFEESTADAVVHTTSEQFTSDGLTLVGSLSFPEEDGLPHPVVLICQDFPHGRSDSSHLDTELAARLVQELGWASFVFSYRGCGDSEGEFSFDGWERDIAAAIDWLWGTHSEEIWLVGFGIGATLGLRVAVSSGRVEGVAAISAFADLRVWQQPSNSAKLAQHLTQLKIRHSAAGIAPADAAAATDEHSSFTIDSQAQEFAPKPFLVVHGHDDPIAPAIEMRAIADIHAQADLRVLEGAGHNLRSDPRALALLFSWLDRNRT